jgi:hypothetical protein
MSGLTLRWDTYLEIFVGGLLPFLGHGFWWRTGKRVNKKEKDSRNGNPDSSVQKDSDPFARWCFCTGTMRAKSNPPGCIASPLVLSADNKSFSEACRVKECAKRATQLEFEVLPSDVSVMKTYRLSFPAASIHSNQPSFCPSAASIVRLVLVAACPPISSLCRLMSDWRSRGQNDFAAVTRFG